jgi:predicted GNAT family N-acyltransferase
MESDVLVLGRWNELKGKALPLRLEVFVKEQGVPLELESDEFDEQATHALVTDHEGRVIATGRLLTDGRIGRLAVASDRRSAGVGKKVLQALMDRARDLGMAQVHLHARVEAEPFYRKFGFTSQGGVFDEAGSPHIQMVRDFSS